MKMRIGLLLSLIVIILTGPVSGQEWLESINRDQLNRGELNLFEIQKSFNDYWAPKNVKEGYYDADGEKLKAYGWKQFKRWEWFWENRVDPESGDFPKTSSFYELREFRDQNPPKKSGGQFGNWTSMGPNSSDGGYSGIGRLNCVAFHPTDNNTIYVGAAAGGIWKSSNGGGSWTTLSDDNAVLGVSDIVVLSGGSSEIIYIATGDRDAGDNYSVGVLKSVDGGQSWNTTGLSWGQNYGRLINRLLIDPSNFDILYAATSYGLYKTINAGSSWTKTSSLNFIDIEMKPGNSNVIYASTNTGGDVYRSTDSGNSWSQIVNTDGKRAQLAVSQNNPEIVYSLICGSDNGLYGIYKSTNGGSSFNQVHGSSPNLLTYACDGSGSGGQGWYDLCIAADPNNANNVFVGGVNTWESSNGGSTWSISNHWSTSCGGTATEVHADKHFLAFQNNSSVLFECNDGGLYRTDDSGNTWDDLSNGLEISQLYRLGVAQTNSAYVVGGLQDNGTKARTGGSWDDVIGGDGMDCAIDPTNHNIQYGELYYGRIYRTTNNWASSTCITTEFSNAGAWVTPYTLDPNNPSVIYVGYNDVWKRDMDGGSGWVRVSNLGTYSLRSIAVAPSNSNVIVAATQSNFYRTTNGGGSWATIPRPASATITSVSIDSEDPDHLWASFGQFNSYGVYESKDGGLSWTNISTGLPAVPINSVIENKQNTKEMELYAGTDVGVYLKLGDADWTMFSEGLPNVVVTELEIYYDSNPASSILRAATYGRGLWESDLQGSSESFIVAFTENPIIVDNATEDIDFAGSISGKIDYSGTNARVYSKKAGPTWLQVDPTTGSLSGTPVNEDVGLNTFTVKVDVGSDGTAEAFLLITVTNTNDAPVFNIDPISGAIANQDSPYTGNIATLASDEDGDEMTFTKVSGPVWLNIGNNGVITGTPDRDDIGANQWIVSVNDGNGGTDQATLNIQVMEVNYPPEFIEDPIVEIDAYEDAIYSSSIYDDAEDPDSDQLTFTKVSGPAWLVVAEDGALSGTPLQDDIGTYTYSVSANDGKGGIAEAGLLITVLGVNDAPVFSEAIITRPDAPYNEIYSATLEGEALDEDGDELIFSISGPSWLTCSSTGVLSGSPVETDDGLNTWTVSASDGGETATAQLQIEVVFINSPPEFNADPVIEAAGFEDITYFGSIADKAADSDGDALTFSKSGGPDWLAVNPDGSLTGTPAQSDTGLNSFIVAVSDGTNTDAAGLNIIINAVNDAPEFLTNTISLSDAVYGQGYYESIAGEASDIDGDPVQYKILTGPGWLILYPDGTLSGEPMVSNEGPNTWTIEASDGNGGTDIASLEILVVQPEPYCEPYAWNSSGIWINSVVFNTIPSSTGNDGGYGIHTDRIFQFDENTLVNLTLSAGYSARSSFVYWNIWIDYDKDGNFDSDGELVFSSNKSKNSLSDSFTVSGSIGSTRMRVSVSDRIGATPCLDNRNGEVEDYTVEITTVGPKPPIADFKADENYVTPGAMINFTDLSTNDPTTYDWDFGNGNSSNLKNPTAVYNNPGNYTVTFTARNNNGSDTKVKTGYIVVTEYGDLQYCEPININNSLDYINEISIGGSLGAYGQGVVGYNHLSFPTFSLVVGMDHSISLSPFNVKNRNFWRIWIDLNADGDFEDSGEVLYSGNNKKGTINSSITIPSTAKFGSTRMRVTMRTGSAPGVCDDNFNGEVEDYDVNLIAGNFFIGGGSFGSEDEGTELEFNIYPNPVSEVLTVQADNFPDESSVRIYNLLGQNMIWLSLKSDFTDINVGTLEKGIYFLVFESPDQREVKKFVKN